MSDEPYGVCAEHRMEGRAYYEKEHAFNLGEIRLAKPAYRCIHKDGNHRCPNKQEYQFHVGIVMFQFNDLMKKLQGGKINRPANGEYKGWITNDMVEKKWYDNAGLVIDDKTWFGDGKIGTNRLLTQEEIDEIVNR